MKSNKNSNDLVSIVVPVYNAEKFLADTINSVLEQSYNNFELILVNDCSKDNSKDIYNKFKNDKRIKWIDQTKNGGAALARNKGIEASTGRLVCFLDADDKWDKEKLTKQVNFMKEKKCAFSYTGYQFADYNCVPNGSKVYVPKTLTYRQVLGNTTIWTSTVMFDLNKISKRDIFMPNVKSEDTATWWKILRTKENCAYGLNEILSFYRRSPGTLSSNKLEAIKRIWNLYRKHENLSLVQSLFYFVCYAFNALKRRI